MRNLSLADDGGTVEIDVGDILSVRLPENATTGYRWAPDAIDPEILALMPEASSYAGAAVGSGGEVIFQACAVAPGTTDLAFKNWREWEGDSSVVERFRIEVTVRAPD